MADKKVTQILVANKLYPIDDNGIEEMINITYSELKSLRDNNKLIPGQQYRITDYETTTIEDGTKSAGHPFDIIVVADDEKTLNENARAIQSKRDTDGYFANSNLSAWELKYTINNDTNKFWWADGENGKGVVYYMKDEFNNECPYDFKNIQYKGSLINDYENYGLESEEYYYTFTNAIAHYQYQQWGTYYNVKRDSSLDKTIDGVYYYAYILSSIPSSWSDNIFYITDSEITSSSTMYNISDETVSEISYGGGLVVNDKYGTFETSIINNYDDIRVYSNKINMYNTYIGIGFRIALNKIIFIGKNYYFNTFGDNCYSNTFGDNCYSNTFGYNCGDNVFGNSCNNNIFGNHFNSNKLYKYIHDNKFGNSCGHNKFGNSCGHNTFGDDCYSNTFGDNLEYSTFGNGCSYNFFGETVTGGHILYLTNRCQYIIFENNCSYIKFKNYSADESEYVQNVHIHLGVYGSSTANMLEISVDRNIKYETEYKVSGSVVNEIEIE